MTIQISGTTVIDQNRYIQNVVGYYGPGIATQAEAQSGTNNDQLMTPLRVKESVQANGTTSVINRVQRGSTSFNTPATNVPIASVNTGKSFISQSPRAFIGVVQGDGTKGQPPYFLVSTGTARLSSSTNVIVQGGNNPGYYGSKNEFGTIDWEVVEFK